MPVVCTPAMNCPSKRAVARREGRVPLGEDIHRIRVARRTDPRQRESDTTAVTPMRDYDSRMTTEHAHLVAALDQLKAKLGDALRTDHDTLNAARADKSGHVAPTYPLAVVEARNVADVQATLRFATAHGIPVVPRGAGTGLAGGAIGSAGEIVLSVRGMDRILEVSVDDELAVVEPGVLNADLNDHLAPRGLWWAPDPASRKISTVGGNIATNAGGLLCVKYGVTREAVLGMKVVLADGRLLELGHRTVKGVTGYDLTALMIGSEGTLGVIVEATLKLRPLPRGTAVTVKARFDSVEQAARASSVVSASGVTPAIMEILDAAAVQTHRRASRHRPRGRLDSAGADRRRRVG